LITLVTDRIALCLDCSVCKISAGKEKFSRRRHGDDEWEPTDKISCEVPKLSGCCECFDVEKLARSVVIFASGLDKLRERRRQNQNLIFKRQYIYVLSEEMNNVDLQLTELNILLHDSTILSHSGTT
jgi:hypothetical protein